MSTPHTVRVRGAVSAEEIAAVVAALQQAGAGTATPGAATCYERWRRGRIAVVAPERG